MILSFNNKKNKWDCVFVQVVLTVSNDAEFLIKCINFDRNFVGKDPNEMIESFDSFFSSFSFIWSNLKSSPVNVFFFIWKVIEICEKRNSKQNYYPHSHSHSHLVCWSGNVFQFFFCLCSNYAFICRIKVYKWKEMNENNIKKNTNEQSKRRRNNLVSLLHQS